MVPGITVFNSQHPWKMLNLNLNIDKYYSTDVGGDECWVLYLEATGAKDGFGEDIPTEIIGARYIKYISRFCSNWGVYA